MQALAHQAPLHVGEGDDDRVDRAALDVGAQLLERQHGGHPIPSGRGRILPPHQRARPIRVCDGALTRPLLCAGEYTTGSPVSETAAGLVINEGGGGMSETPAPAPGAPIHTSEDEQILHKLGYAQELFRAMGVFQNFAISFTIISILAGCLTSYFIAFQLGRPGRGHLGLVARRD